ncbi:MAG: hypothetical protein K9L98_02090 [Candidatus Pacebacteria bacterium]|nr:hypothetical protein [Candidatus Paceibacterota bacterium]MCF7862776.1 hypothetical protein [Candidatus Paceibacterota bacterium]
MTAKDHVKEWLDSISKRGGYIEKQEIIFLMVQARHLIENHPNISKYRTIEFYSNWVVHTQLDRPSEVSLSIFRDITKILSANWNPTDPEMGNQISKVIGLSTLRTELVSLFQENNLNVELFSIYENWKNIAVFLIYFLQNKPLVFPKTTKNKFKLLIEEIMNLKKPADFWIKNLSIIGIDNRPHWCFELGGEKNTTKIIGELFIEKDPA